MNLLLFLIFIVLYIIIQLLFQISYFYLQGFHGTNISARRRVIW